MSSRPVHKQGFLGLSATWLCGGALALNLLLVIGLVGLLAWHGLGYFWQKDLVLFTLKDETQALGQVFNREEIPEAEPPGYRIRVKTANRDLDQLDFRWIDESEILEQSLPAEAILIEREEYGNFHGTLVELRRGDETLAQGFSEIWAALPELLERKERERAEIHDLDNSAIGDLNYEIEELRRAGRRLELESGTKEDNEFQRKEHRIAMGRLEDEFEELSGQLNAKRALLDAESLIVEAADGRRQQIPAGQLLRVLRPNAMNTGERWGLYFSRIGEFLFDQPRESNTEGGIFPAIFGTVMMVFLMSVAVVPLGVLAALYLREYARQGLVVRLVRISVNNLAGVPSIVFGVFGLGFFVYLIGGSIDQWFYPEVLPTATFGTGGILWGSLTLALLTVPVVIVATEEGLAAVPRTLREGSLALGATRFETTWRVVIPAAAPGMLTGVILAIARAAGEVAPLMILGMVKLAPSLPLDHHAPFVHLERKFMHLGFHIYDLGFQSPNVEASRPLVFATALLLVLLVVAMNLVAIAARNHLQRKYAVSAV